MYILLWWIYLYVFPEKNTRKLTISPKSSMLNGKILMQPSTMNRQGRIQVKVVSRLPWKPILYGKNKCQYSLLSIGTCKYQRSWGNTFCKRNKMIFISTHLATIIFTLSSNINWWIESTWGADKQGQNTCYLRTNMYMYVK